MARSNKITRRKIVQPDPLYGDELISRFVNRVMRNGKKSAAQEEVYEALEIIKAKTNQDPLLVFRQAMENVRPQMEVRSRRVGGASYQVPAPVRGERRDSLATRWIIQAAQKRPSTELRTFAEKLSAELIDAFNNTGGAMKKKEDTHRMADANKAFAHFRW